MNVGDDAIMACFSLVPSGIAILPQFGAEGTKGFILCQAGEVSDVESSIDMILDLTLKILPDIRILTI